MKKRQIILDFTSLLDVIMIILFFFIIFSNLETDNLRKDLEDKQQQVSSELEEAKAKNDKADELLGEAQEKNEQADKRMEEANSAVDRSGDNADAIMDFSENKNLKLHLDMSGESGWTLKFAKGEEIIKEVPKADISEMTDEVRALFAEQGYTADNTILIEFSYDATENGTTSAYLDTMKIITAMKNEYEHLFYSETDVSVFNG
ncbi:MAG: biopolymer transporter ExbD [Ruminiclostridium sp.]